jgi:putative transposase
MRTFFRDEDYREYLSLLGEWCGQHGNRIWAYCLMPNHVHVIVVPASEDGLARGIGEAHRRYSRRINFREGWRGHLWQGRFASFVMDEPHLPAAARYVERNPVKAGLVDAAEDWPWSSAAAHVGDGSEDPQAMAETAWLSERIAGWICTWREYLLEPEEAELAMAMRQRENTGRPLGDLDFIGRLGALLGRDLLPKKRGPKGPRRMKP